MLGKIGFLVISFNLGLYVSGIVGKPLTNSLTSLFSLKNFFTIRSSREWKVIIATLPSGFKRSKTSGNTSFRTDNSLLTSILIA